MALPRPGIEHGRERPGAGSGPNAGGSLKENGVESSRRPHTFILDEALVERAREQVGEPDMVRSIEAALAAAIDYTSWVREVREGRRDVLS